MKALRATALLVAIFLSAMPATSPAAAAEINVIAAGAVRGIIASMIEDYSRQSGLKFNLIVGPTGQLRDAIASGKPTDLVIVSAPLMAEMEKSGKIASGSRIDLGRVGLGVVVRQGTPSPDISTPEAVKAALIKANTIAYTDPKLGGTSVEQLMKFAESTGIKDEVVRKGVISTGGNDAAAKVADGKADIAVVPITDIHAKDAKLVGPLPEPIQLWTVYAAAIPNSSADPAAARAFIAAMTAPAMHDRWVKAGWQLAK
jgi:molybdate transport system substrate-binding protein